MKYSKFQKIITYILLTSFFLNISIEIPSITSLVFAKESSFYNLVSIIVDEKTYPQIKNELEIYSQDISKNLENTRVVILPVPNDASPFSIASMNEGLYFDWYKSLSEVDFESKLIWTVFVWNIPLPKVYKWEDSAKTVLPYVDFDEKSFIYNKENKRYEENSDNLNYKIKPEVQFWFISPNTWDYENDVKSIKEYFKKNHDFYTWQWIYSLDASKRWKFASWDSVINWVKEWENWSASWLPYVFYYDYIRENRALNSAVYPAYLATRNRNEDYSFGWYNNEFFQYMTDASSKNQNKELKELATKVDPNFQLPENEDLSKNIYDIQTRLPLEKLKKNFINSFSKGALWELRKDVFNAWRYNFWQNVNVDFIPYLVSKIDIYVDDILKTKTIFDFESERKKVDLPIVSRKIAVPTSFRDEKWDLYKNFLYWNDASQIKSAEECNFYRWWYQLVEANRWNNILLAESDIERLKSMWNICVPNWTIWLWWKNSPLDLDIDSFKLKGSDYKWAIEKLFDINWSKLLDRKEFSNPLQCFDNNFILYNENSVKRLDKRNPIFYTNYIVKWQWWTCLDDNNEWKTYDFKYNHIENEIKDFNDPRNNTTCDVNIFLEWKLVRQLINENYYRINFLAKKPTADSKPWRHLNFLDDDDKKTIPNCLQVYEYKAVDSLMQHRQPTPGTISSQAKNMTSPNLPIDTNWFLDYINENWEYIKTETPSSFRKSNWGLTKEKTLEIAEKVKRLNKTNLKNAEEHPYFWKILKLSNDEISNILKKNWPFLNDKDSAKEPEKEKLDFALKWNYFDSNQKYAYVFENYMKDRGRIELPEWEKPFLPDQKEQYEITYLWSYWTASEMLIWFHPELKGKNPYSETISLNQDISSKIFWSKITSSNPNWQKIISSWQWWQKNSNNSQLWQKNSKNWWDDARLAWKLPWPNWAFKCAPPDWVPITKWMWAIKCWLADLMPPKIKFSNRVSSRNLEKSQNENSISNWGFNQNNSVSNSSHSSQNNLNTQNNCLLDENKNWISDCLEKIDSIELITNSKKYSYNQNIWLVANLLSWKEKLNYINSASVLFEIVKIEKAKDENLEISEKNLDIIFDKNKEDLNDENIISNYVNFKKSTIYSKNSESKYWFSWKNKDVNIYLKASFNNIESNILKVEIRWESLSTLVSNFDKKSNLIKSSIWNVKASENTNIYLLDLWNKNPENFLNIISKNTKSEDNLIIWFNKNNKSWQKLDFSYPLNIKLLKNEDIIEEREISKKEEFISFASITDSGTYKLKITDSNWLSTIREFYVNSASLEKIDLKTWTNLLLSSWGISTNVFTLYDKFNNPVIAENLVANLKISPDFVFIDEGWQEKNNLSENILEWFKIFRVKSKEKPSSWEINITILDQESNKILLTRTEKIRSISNAFLKIDKKEMSVWWEKVKMNLSIIDEKWNLIPSVNSRLYFSWNSNYFTTTKDYFDVKNSVAEIEILTWNISWKNIPVEIQIEWIWKIFQENISIKPLKPVKIDIITEKSKLEASKDKFTYVTFELKDRFNNLVYNDNSTIPTLELSWDISLWNWEKNDWKKYKLPAFKNWVSTVKLFAKDSSWVWYFKVTTEPNLSANSFIIPWDEVSNWKDIVVSWVWENAWRIETYYLLNKENITKTKTLIENWKEVQKQVPMAFNWLYTVLQWANYWDIEQKDYLAWALVFDKNNRTLTATSLLDYSNWKTKIFSLNKNWNLFENASSSDLSQNLETKISIENWKILFNLFNKSFNANIWKIFYNLNNLNLEICEDENCKINENSNIILWKNINSDYRFFKEWDYLVLKNNFSEEILRIEKNWNILKKSDFSFEINKENKNKFLELKIIKWNENIWNILINTFDSEQNISKNKDIFENSKTLKNKNSILVFIESNFYWSYISNSDLVVFYNDPFLSKNSLNQFAKMNPSWFENYENQAWIWWKDDNKTLLSFASWETVWKSVKNFMWFYTINIWDPFLKLKTERKKFTWTNKDKQFDNTIWEIITENEDIIDYKVFDYNNDWRDDILLIKRDNYLELLENKNVSEKFVSQWNLVQIYDNSWKIDTWDFTWDWFDDIFFIWQDWNPYLLNNISKNFTRLDLTNKLWVNSKISQISTFDMDNDNIKDLVVLTESWELNIFYWWWNSWNPTFTKKKIADSLGLTLWKWIRKNGGAIYFSWMYQPKWLVDWLWNSSSEKTISTWLVDSEIFVNVAYEKDEKTLDLQNIDNLTKSIEQTYFLKTEYLESLWISYEKEFKDRNWWVLASWDIVDVEIKLKNTSSRAITNVKLLEKFEKYFTIDRNSITNDKWLEVLNWLSYYDFWLDKFSLWIWETLTIKYSWKTKNLTHIEIKTWYFEKWEPWDDKFWDIIVDDFNRACKTSISTYKSTSAREYFKDEVWEKCSHTKLPASIEKLSKDNDWNWVPDYIEDLKSSPEKLKDYSQEQLSEINKDSDNDWTPDDTDFIDSVSWKLDEAQELLDGLSCGFNSPSCVSMPLNWAPLAPWSDPTFMWKPIWDWLKIDEWIPVFSALTRIHLTKTTIPAVWPLSRWSKTPWVAWAWGELGIDSSSNKFRLFVTPTLTGWIWTAMCFWWSARTFWGKPWKWLSPLTPWWNCLVFAKPLLKCSNDGSEWDPTEVWTADNFSSFSSINWWWAWGSWISWNWHNWKNWSCSVPTWWANINPNYVKDYLASSWWKNNDSVLWVSKFKDATENYSSNNWPLFRVWFEWWTPINVNISSKGDDSFSDIEKIEEKRIQSFPAFLMDWVVRQIDEIIAKLTDFPTIFIILPDFNWIYDSEKSWSENWKEYQNKNSSKNSSNKNKVTQVNSWVREAYEFISTLPLVNLEQETLYVNIPWISDIEINRAKESWNKSLNQWEKELNKYKTSSNYNEKVWTQINWLIWSIRKNIQVIEEYKKIPEKVKALINKKQDYLDQILYNVEIISEFVWGRIWKNWERFKAWVELYILIKAVLKSWQSFVDIFIEYDEECHECKNERHDLLDFQFELISMLVPKIPVVEFPKWPDIILDFHNIRASIDVSIPDFEVKHTTINLPNLPKLSLPDTPNVNVNIDLPDLPILPTFEIPELPDFPTIPEIELPDLPPPLKLPKLFEWFEFIIDIAKLITKAMCLLKSLPLHPEWRAWDQISFLTERNWYKWFDFTKKIFPKITLPSVDAIEVKTYVNLELETDFLVNFAESVIEPLNNFTWDFTNKLKVSTSDIDFSSIVPNEINVDINAKSSAKASFKESLNKKLNIANIAMSKLNSFVKYSEKNKNILLTNAEFKANVAKFLANELVVWDKKFDNLRETWNTVNKYNFSSENKLILDLQKFNQEKYETLKNIFETEKEKNKNLEIKLDEIYSWKVKVSDLKNSSINLYKEEISKYNKKTFENIWKVVNFKEENSVYGEIKRLWQEVKERTKNTIWKRAEELKPKNTPLEIYKKWLVALNDPNLAKNLANSWTCSGSWHSKWWYSYSYSWIYIIENWKSYRLFDYIDEVNWDEWTKAIDFDWDSDEDLLYFVNNTLYLKENFSKKDDKKVYLNEKPIILEYSYNKFFKENKFLESVNNAYESDISSWLININFKALENVYNYRLSFYDIIDKHHNPFREEIDLYKNKHIIDWIVSNSEKNIVSEEENFIKSKDLAYIWWFWNFRWIELESFKLKSIKEDLLAWKSVTISSWTRLYSWPNLLELNYLVDSKTKQEKLRIEPNSHITAKEDIIIMWISRWDWYINTWEKYKYIWDEISKMKWFPILLWSKINFVWDKNSLQLNSFLDIFYYDNSEIRLDFNKINSWELYDLWEKESEYLFSVNRKNDYYYAKINWFKNNILWTSTKQILLSPQLKADKNTPDIELNSIKIPVYQELDIDITDKIIEDSWIDWIKKLYIDYFLEVDRDGDLNSKNDDDSVPNLRIFKKDWKIFIKAWKFSNLVNKKIWINLIDENWNHSFKEIDFVVYAPIPEIEAFNWNIISWRISEELKDEPINFYKFRAWNLSKLWDEKWNLTVMTNEKWEFNIKTSSFKWWLTIKNSSWFVIANISEKTWKISLTQKNKLIYDVFASKQEKTNFPEILIKDKDWKNIFSQIIKVNWKSKVSLVSDFESLDFNWIYLKLSNNFDYGNYILPENILNNPWVFVWHNKKDLNKKPIFMIYPDWRLDIPNDFKIDYSDYKDFVVLKISDKNWNNLFDILYKIDADYVVN